jgi:hypothetical protein
MKKAITLLLATLLILASLSSCLHVVFSQVQIGVKSGDWMKYDIVVEEANFTGWIRFDLNNVEAGIITYSSVTYSDTTGNYTYASGQYNLGDISAYVVYPNDTIETFIIPANLKAGDTLLFYGMSAITIAGETSETYLGATRDVLYATYTPVHVPSEASSIDYKWDKATGIALEYTAYYPDGKTTTGMIADTNMWQPESAGVDLGRFFGELVQNPYLLYTVIIVVAAIVVVAALLAVRARRKRGSPPTSPKES